MRYISHELRTPLNIVYVGLRLLDKELSEGSLDVQETSVIVSDMKTAADVALTVLNDLLLLDKINQGLLVAELTDRAPIRFIEETVAPFHVQVNEAG